MPSYNTASFIGEAISSVIFQTYQNWELIIVDDFSSDNTEEIVSQFKDDRIYFYKNQENRGAAFSRNKAISIAKGKWIAFLDSDDIWEKEKLEKQILFMENNNYHFSYTEYIEFTDNHISQNNRIVSGPRCIKKNRMYRYCWPGCLTVMYDSSFVGRVQIADIKKNNDYAMWLIINKKADCYLLKEVLGRYRKGRAGSISNHGFFKLIKWHYLLFKTCQNENFCCAFYHTCVNVIYGFWKKIRYVRAYKR